MTIDLTPPAAPETPETLDYIATLNQVAIAVQQAVARPACGCGG